MDILQRRSRSGFPDQSNKRGGRNEPKNTRRREGSGWRANTFYLASGKRTALAEFTHHKGMFVKDELYIFVLGSKGTMLAHAVNLLAPESFTMRAQQSCKTF